MTSAPLVTHRLRAWDTRELQLSPEQARLISQTDLASVEVHSPPTTWWVKTESKIGILGGPDWELRVTPHLAIPKLMFLLGFASKFGWKESDIEVGVERDLFSAIASGFAFHAQRAIEPAPLRGYVAIEEEATALRGRLRVSEQISRSRGLPLPLQIAHDDYLPDVIENRLVKTAAELLLRLPRLPARTGSSLRRIRSSLESVGSVDIPFSDDPPPISRLNRHYEAALGLACLILEGASITAGDGRTTSIGFVFDMNKIFEDFLSAALIDALHDIGGSVQLQYGGRHLDHEGELRLKPDITWWQGGRCRGIVDAKYKQLRDARFPNSDAYQMLAYCTAFALPGGFLVYAQDREQRPRTHHLRDERTRIHVRTIDVEQAPEKLLAEVDRLAHEIAASGQGLSSAEFGGAGDQFRTKAAPGPAT
jgi:5-methylcytosine-specific restriction enzyme subunit McrC